MKTKAMVYPPVSISLSMHVKLVKRNKTLMVVRNMTRWGRESNVQPETVKATYVLLPQKESETTCLTRGKVISMPV